MTQHRDRNTSNAVRDFAQPTHPPMNDFAKLKHWIALMRNDQVLLGNVTERMGGITLALIEQGFATGKDPYGKTWAPKKKRDGRGVLIGKTLRLSRGWRRLRVDARKYMVVPSVDYAAPHQDPREGRRPRRMMVPSREKGIPRLWKAALSRAAIAAMKKHFESK